MSADIQIDVLLKSLGFGDPHACGHARSHLEALKLTVVGKQRISMAKVSSVRRALTDRFVLICGHPVCGMAAPVGKEKLVSGDPSHCEICQGSDNRRSARRLADVALTQIEQPVRLLVVGGASGSRTELRALQLRHVELRLVDGNLHRTGSDAHKDLGWADLVLIWAPTELSHKVSQLYVQRGGCGYPQRLTVPRRGVAALLDTVADNLSARGRVQLSR